jgi:hypothetical protein
MNIKKLKWKWIMLFCKIVVHICLDYIEVHGNVHYLYVYMCEHLGHERFLKI